MGQRVGQSEAFPRVCAQGHQPQEGVTLGEVQAALPEPRFPLWRKNTCQKLWAERGKQDACVQGPEPWGQLSSARLSFQTSNKFLFLHFQGF